MILKKFLYLNRSMNLNFSALPEFDNHKEIIELNDPDSSLRGFIAIHNTNLGPATGGTRYWYYATEEGALREALRLSRAMTYKCALAGVPYGGGKAVIIADNNHPKDQKMLYAYAQKVNNLGGRFTTGEDMGIDGRDIRIMEEISPYVLGKYCGDLAPWTALGIFLSIKEALNEVYGSMQIAGKTFAVKGLGKVGYALCKIILQGGGKIFASDLDESVIKQVKSEMPEINIVDADKIFEMPSDVFCPCANGGDLRAETIKNLKCKIICGGANNQLATRDDGQQIFEAGILYIPDYVANAGGLINIVDELEKDGYNETRVKTKVEEIAQTVRSIINLSRKLHLPLNEIADQLAREKIKNVSKKPHE